MTKLLALVAATTLTVLASCQSAKLDGATGESLFGYAATGSRTPDENLAVARNNFQSADYRSSYKAFKQVAEARPNDASAWLGLAASADRLGEFKAADTAYGTLVKLRPGNAEVYNNLGYSYLLRGKLKTAYTYLAKARKLDPTNTTIANNLQMLRDSAAQPRRK